MSQHDELLDVTHLPMEDVAEFMQEDWVSLPFSMRAVRATQHCGILIGGFMYEVDPGDIIVDAAQKMKRIVIGEDVFDFFFDRKL